ncbi:hypothetical protein EU803_16655 [Loktanella sp. IMCC34160]|uniref:hypothetical protein n=1 Tax=Loktanella sp. IMCC34160 TaxID=2510646 RepID=UPI00101BB86E|nr:hypothetical protein [Loktanella sp. IMCC34160]RYG89781.1 hypothetical protein EU803_16655 [Loktanella sp. IMCC34160]
MQINLNRAKRSKLHTAMRDAIGVGADPTDTEEVMLSGFIEAFCWADYPGEAFELARALDAHIYSDLHRSDFCFVTVDACELRDALGAKSVNMALRMCGMRPRQRGSRIIWSDAPGNEPTMTVTLPADLLDRWNEDV